MEPASTLAVVALAVTTVVPPFIEVRLRNWENRTKKSFEFCKTKKTLYFQKIVEKPPLAQLDSGNKTVDALIYSETNHSPTSLGRVLGHSDSDTEYYFDFLLVYYPHFACQVACVHSSEKNRHGTSATLLDERIQWEKNNPPDYISIQIDAIIECEDLRNSSFKVQHEMWLEKLK